MYFKVRIDVNGLPQTSNPKQYFSDNPVCGDVLLEGANQSYRALHFRSGDYVPESRGRDDVFDSRSITLVYDDFVPGETLDNKPKWYDSLKSRILSVTAMAEYGAGQNISVCERVVHGCATARIRNVQATWGNAGNLVYCVKIIAQGPEALHDARELHKQILAGSVA